MLRRMAFALMGSLIGLVVSTGVVSADPATVVFVERTGLVPSACANEQLLFDIREVLVVRDEPDHFVEVRAQHGEAIGQTTGDVYRWIYRSGTAVADWGDNTTIHGEIHYLLVSRGGEVRETIVQRVSYTLIDGEWKVQHYTLTEDCA